MTLPAFPDAGEPCINTTPLMLVAICVGGQRVLAWEYVSEIFNETAPRPLTASKSSAPCAKVKLLETAVSLKWSPEQVATVAKALGLK